MRTHRKKFLSAAFCLLAFVFFFSCAAQAQKKESYTELEKAGFAFHRFSGVEPDFKAWIFQSQKYKNATPVEKVEILQNDIHRLQNGYYNYMPDTDLISVNLPLLMEIPTLDDVEGTGSYTRVRINFKNLPENYLPMQVGNFWIALVIEDFGRIADISLSAEQYAEIARRVKYAKGGKTEKFIKTNVEIKLRPLSVDTSAPMILDDIEMWLMLADMGSAELSVQWPSDKETLWRYEAPWYATAEAKELFKLYKQ